MYPQLRVFDPTPLSSGVVPLPDNSVHPSPYVLFDTTGGAGAVDASDLEYSAEVTVLKVTGVSHGILLLCPTGWTTPAGLNAALLLPGSTVPIGADGPTSWRVLYDFPHKLISVLSISGSGGAQVGPQITPPQLFHGGGAPVSVTTITGVIVEADDAPGELELGGFDLLTQDIAFTLSKISTGVNGVEVLCPNGWTVNGAANTDLVLPGSTVPAVGAWLIYTDFHSHRIIVRPAV